jgi:hypothetical protein
VPTLYYTCEAQAFGKLLLHLSEILETRDNRKREWVMKISKGSTTLRSKLLEDPSFVLGSEGMGGEEKRREEKRRPWCCCKECE